jgi:hypothetical protein
MVTYQLYITFPEFIHLSYCPAPASINVKSWVARGDDESLQVNTAVAYVRTVADTRFIPDGWGLASVVPGAAPGAPHRLHRNPGLE